VAFFVKTEVLFHTFSAPIRQIFTKLSACGKTVENNHIWDATNIHRKCGKIRWNW